MDEHDFADNESALASSQHRLQRSSGLLAIVGVGLIIALCVPANMVAEALATGPKRYLTLVAVMAALFVPMVLLLLARGKKHQAQLGETMARFERDLTQALARAEQEANVREAQVRRQDFETRLSNALEMADDEAEVIDVVERAFRTTVPEAPAELLLADNSHAHLTRMAVSAPDGEPPLCPVDSPDQCPAARRAQPQRFRDSDEIDACPKLRDRAHGNCSALCVPVSVMGRTVGVIHTIDAPGIEPADGVVHDLGTLAKLAGARIGVMRMMAETQVQASTDSLTGLLNRRAMENKARPLHDGPEPMSVVMADLDHFKALNDTYGHDTGDRALRTFAQTLKTSVRRDDLVSRHGGEEFALVLPGCGATQTRAILEKVRSNFTAALQAAGLPNVTASFGVVTRHSGEALAASLARADVALFQAKHEGRNCVVVHDTAEASTGQLDADLVPPDLETLYP
jgi:diguanylate cyclase (GGDEF)-like protein